LQPLSAKIFWFFQELRRRQVFKVGAAYAVSAWVIVQLTDILVDEGALPAGAALDLMIVAVVGAPIVIALTWIYDLTPQGFKATQRALTDALTGNPIEPTTTGAVTQSALAAVAVLPFGKLTPASQYAYLADALPIELQSLLSRMSEIRVVSQRSSVAHSGSGSDLKTIARDLRVQYVISGSVAEVGDRLKIQVQLDDAVDDTLLWSERYDVAAGDVDTVQREISEKVVGTFGGERLRTEIRRANEAAATERVAARAEGARVSARLQAGIDRGLDSAAAAPSSSIRSTDRLRDLGLVTAEKTLNGISADVAVDRRFAIEVIGRAEQLAPRDAVVLRAAGCVHAWTGNYRHSIELLRRAIKLAPYELGAWGYLGWPLVATGATADLDEVHQIVTRLLTTSPRHPGRVYWLFHNSVAYVCADDCENALAQAEEFTSEQPRFALGCLHLANVLGRLNRHTEARAAVDKSLQHNPLLTPAYYAELMAVLTDQPQVVARRTSGLAAAGLITT
jgi:TolB-like protein